MDEKRVLVTGASRGIGRATAIRLASTGWKVAVHFGAHREEADQVAEALGDACSGVYHSWFQKPDAGKVLIERVLADGRLDALVNNAGVYGMLDFVGSTDSEWEATMRQTFEVDYFTPARLVREACRAFIAQGGGKVVNVASRVGHRGEARAAAYSGAKAALINLTRALAVEHAKLGVQHFAIAPGWVETAMAREGMEQRLPEILRDIPLGRVARAEDCASTIAFLLSDEAEYLSGIVIDINGASYLR
ncbi:MAG: SDR family NAD(P)-dependent oxidoreductase [Fimbriimonadaceae bacterium]